MSDPNDPNEDLELSDLDYKIFSREIGLDGCEIRLAEIIDRSWRNGLFAERNLSESTLNLIKDVEIDARRYLLKMFQLISERDLQPLQSVHNSSALDIVRKLIPVIESRLTVEAISDTTAKGLIGKSESLLSRLAKKRNEISTTVFNKWAISNGKLTIPPDEEDSYQEYLDKWAECLMARFKLQLAVEIYKP